MKATAILTADWHLREDTPVCRTDKFWNTMWRKVDFVADLQREHDCPVLIAGDLGQYWKWSPYLISKAIEHLPDETRVIYGQHDLPNHSLALAYKSGVHTLVTGNHVKLMEGTHFGQDPVGLNFAFQRRVLLRVLLWHNFTWTRRKPWPTCTADPAEELLKKYSKYDLIITGDNHQPFVVQRGGRLLVNPGSLMRQTADQADHRPRVYLWYAEDNSVEPVYIPIEEGAVSREHIEKTEQRDERIEAFVSRLSEDWDVTVDFETNMERFLEENKIRQSVKDIIRKAMGK